MATIAVAVALAGLAATPAVAAAPDLPQAESLIKAGRYEAAHAMLAPFQDSMRDDARLAYLLGLSALGSGRAEEAKVLFERAIALDPDSARAHLALGRAYYALNQLAEAKIEFETVLRFDNLPPDLTSQVETYNQVAKQTEAGKALSGFGYFETGIGNYRVNDTIATTGGERNDTFFNARAGGGANYGLGKSWSLDATLDYRFRYYDNPDTRDDSDIRWSVAVSRPFGDANLALGSRGRVSYRGDGQYRNDYGGYADWTQRLDSSNEFEFGGTIWRRQYPSGRLRERSRTIGELTAGWTHGFGKAVTLEVAGRGGYNWATERPDGESSQYGAETKLDFTFTKRLGGFVMGWWEHDDYNIDRIRFHPDPVDNGAVFARTDNLYEAGGGMVWGFAPGLTLRPEVLYIHDQSNVFVNNYSSTEVWLNVRYRF